jgi:hypothetical protein
VSAINVKVSTKKVIALLEKRLTELKKGAAKYEKELKEYQAADKAYDEAVAAFVPTGKHESVHIRHHWANRNESLVDVEVTYKVKKSQLPKRPESPTAMDGINSIGDIEQALRILNMTDEEVVNASTFKAVSKFF